jgi:hypothetical protein
MAVKPNAKLVRIKEQIIDDPASGLTLMFSACPGPYTDSIRYRLRICGDALRFGNREFLFTGDGELGATGCATGGVCETSWIREVVSEEERARRDLERDEWFAKERERIRAEEDPNFEWGVEGEESDGTTDD